MVKYLCFVARHAPQSMCTAQFLWPQNHRSFKSPLSMSIRSPHPRPDIARRAVVLSDESLCYTFHISQLKHLSNHSITHQCHTHVKIAYINLQLHRPSLSIPSICGMRASHAAQYLARISHASHLAAISLPSHLISLPSRGRPSRAAVATNNPLPLPLFLPLSLSSPSPLLLLSFSPTCTCWW